MDTFSRKLQAYLPKIPIILHTLGHGRKAALDLQSGSIIVEKKGDSVEQIQAALQKLLSRSRIKAPIHGRECKIS